MSLLRKLLANKPVNTQLEFGIQSNVRLIAMNNDVKLRDGEPVPTHMYLTFGKFDDEGKLIGQSEFDWFNLNPEYDNVIGNLSTEVSQLTSLVNIINPGHEFDPTSEYESYEELEADVKTKKGCKSLMDSIWKALKITTKELKDKAKGLIDQTTAKADAGGEKPTAAGDILDI